MGVASPETPQEGTMQSQQAFQRRHPDIVRPAGDGAALSRGLGLFSVGLGLTELAAPRLIARAIGVDPEGRTATAVRALGVREIFSGIGVLLQPTRPLPLWARLAGDVMNLGIMMWAAKSKRT